ncbi:hypothetical protein BKA81DRAFT_381005 [Phyllosticta paracitricarpa]
MASTFAQTLRHASNSAAFISTEKPQCSTWDVRIGAIARWRAVGMSGVAGSGVLSRQHARRALHCYPSFVPFCLCASWTLRACYPLFAPLHWFLESCPLMDDVDALRHLEPSPSLQHPFARLTIVIAVVIVVTAVHNSWSQLTHMIGSPAQKHHADLSTRTLLIYALCTVRARMFCTSSLPACLSRTPTLRQGPQAVLSWVGADQGNGRAGPSSSSEHKRTSASRLLCHGAKQLRRWVCRMK